MVTIIRLSSDVHFLYWTWAVTVCRRRRARARKCMLELGWMLTDQ